MLWRQGTFPVAPMLRRVLCALLTATLAFSCIFSLAGCDSAPKTYGNVRRTQEAAMRSLGMVIENNLDIEYVYSDNEYTDNYLVISGLKNKSVEEAINNRILEVYDFMSSGEYIPPYRGIKVLMQKVEGVSPEINVYFMDCASYNNILSVTASCGVSYNTDDPDNLVYYSWIYPLNFNLVTGKELTLADLFYRDANYLDVLNALVGERLMDTHYDDEMHNEWYDYGPRLAAPFTGLSADQRFYLTWDGSLALVLDYDTPEFATDYYPETLTIDDCEQFAFTGTCFSSGQSIFTDTRETPNLLPNYYEGLPNNVENTTMDANVTLRRTVSEISDLPEALQSEMIRLSKDESLLAVPIQKLSDQYGSNDNMSIEVDISCTSCFRYGDYTSISVSTTESVTNTYSYDNLYYVYTNTSMCYKGDNPQVLQLSDLFVPDADCDAIIKQVLIGNMQDAIPDNFDETVIAAYVDEMLGRLTGFSVEDDRLYLTYRADEDSLDDTSMFGQIVRKYFYENEFPEEFVYPCNFACYSDIGAENLVIFD